MNPWTAISMLLASLVSGADAGLLELRHAVRDAAHGGPAHFYFLSGTPAFRPTGAFDPSRSAVVHVCHASDVVCNYDATRAVATDIAGIADVESQRYTAHLGAALGHIGSLTGTYRIHVTVDGAAAGHIELQVSERGRARAVATSDDLGDASDLDLHFRVEEGFDAPSLVPPVAPDTLPVGLYEQKNTRAGAVCASGPMLRDVLVVAFKQGTTRDDKQAAVDAVSGEVIGGRPPVFFEGYYYVRVSHDDSGRILCDAVQTLNSFPSVDKATLELFTSGAR